MKTHTPIAPLGAGPSAHDDFKIYSSLPDVKFLTRAVQPPSLIYVTVDDDLMGTAATFEFGEDVTVSYRLLRADGQLVYGQFHLRPGQTQTNVSHTENLAEGFLLSVSCQAAVATQRGMTFVRLFLSNPSFGPGLPSYVLFSDYVTTSMAPAHPNGRVLAPTEGPGLIYIFKGTIPAAGAQFVINPPFNTRWRIMTVAGFLTTSAVVGNRTPRLTVNDGTGERFFGGGPVLQPASVQYGYCWAGGAGFSFDGINRAVETFPDNFHSNSNSLLATFTNGMDPADQWTAGEAYVEQWLENV